MMRTICVVTGTRAEFGLLQWLMQEIREDPALTLQVLATGMHLSPEFGLTYRSIEDSGFSVDKKVEILLSSDSAVGISKSMGLGMISLSEALAELQPDLVVLLGDRFETFAAASAAMIGRIPIAHLHGGETTEGAYDEAMRHAITKMSHLHFTATETYRQRVIQLGEPPDRVYHTGAPALDGIARLDLLSREDLEEALSFRLGECCLLVTFHPVTLERNASAGHFAELLEALDVFPRCRVLFTRPNADSEGREIIRLTEAYVRRHPTRCHACASLGQLRYLSALRQVDAVIGNSSSGLIEAPSFKIPAVNIGDRQKGRIKAASVIDCLPEKESIIQAVNRALDPAFRTGLAEMENPYGSAGASKRIRDILRTVDLSDLLKKTFFDIAPSD